MGNTNPCSHATVRRTRVPEYRTRDFGIPLLLVNAAYSEEFCPECEQLLEISIPNPNGLVAAAALYRVTLPQKLVGSEIRFVRKALGYSAKKLSEALDATPETVSRWEHDKQPMGPTAEKLLRLIVGANLVSRAQAIAFDPQQILDMKINAVREPGAEIEVGLELVRFKKPDLKTPTEEYSEAA
jgi:DNA-binding transcriptional regulator YiaG